MSKTSWIDVHAHLDRIKKEKSVEQILEEAKKSGVEHILTIGTSPEDLSEALELAEKFFPTVVCALGIHPHEARLFDSESRDFMRKHLSAKHVVAVGEIGLDYHYNHSKPEVQREVFREQLQLALEYDLPIEIHTREAEKDTVEILKETNPLPKGLVHCFTGTKWLAEQALSLGLNLSFSGVITFKKAESLREILRETPLDRLHIETDAPYLSPIPLRGKTNFPSHMIHTAKKAAEIKNISLDSLAEQTLKNSQALFKKWKLCSKERTKES